MSAGLDWLEQCCQHAGGIFSLISLTLFATNISFLLMSPLIHDKVIVESDQHVTLVLLSKKRAFLMNFTNLEHKRAPINSKRGKVMVFMGATRDLEITNETL